MEVPVLEFIQQGGVVMYVLLGASVLSLTITFERAWSLRRSVVIPLAEVKQIEQAVREGDVKN